MSINYRRSIDVVAEPDVLICGAGCAGVAAALSSARLGARTMVVEQWGFAGGNITAALVTSCCGLCDQGTGEVVVGGVALELLDRTGVIKLPLASRKLFEPVLEGYASSPSKLPIRFDSEKFKIAADHMLAEVDIQVLYHTKVADVGAAASRIDNVVIANKGGLAAIRPKMVVDCTGDADVAAWAGVPCEVDPHPETMTLVFQIADVNITPDLATLQAQCSAVLEKARDEGRIGLWGGPWFSSPRPGVVKLNATRLPFNSASPEELTRAEIKGRQDAWTMFELWKERLPEFKDAYFQTSGPLVGSRESRRMSGAYTLTLDDVLNARRFPDVVVKGAWYVDRHPTDQAGYHQHVLVKPYDIPYRTLLPQGVENLLVAGRCHSATSAALASSRVGITAMGMGQAAGIAAALAAEGKITPQEVSVKRLQAELLKGGAILE